MLGVLTLLPTGTDVSAFWVRPEETTGADFWVTLKGARGIAFWGRPEETRGTAFWGRPEETRGIVEWTVGVVVPELEGMRRTYCWEGGKDLLSTTLPSGLLLEEGWRVVTTGNIVGSGDVVGSLLRVLAAVLREERVYTGVELAEVSELVCRAYNPCGTCLLLQSSATGDM